jgi:CBS domain-containing protein
MVRQPAVHSASTTVAEIRAFFADDHVHMALLVDDGELVGALERADLGTCTDNRTAARHLAKLGERTISPTAPVEHALTLMRRSGRRRLAVTDAHGALLGLLCLKASGNGFCSDQDVAARLKNGRTH